MKRHLVGLGGGIAGIGLTSVLGYLIATNASSAPAWPYWLFGAITAAGTATAGTYLLSQRRTKTGPNDETDDDHDDMPAEPPPRPPGPAITDRWGNINDGFRAPAMLRIRNHAISHPGYTSDSNPPPSMRTAMLVACAPLGSTPPTSDIRARFLAFLNGPAVSALLAAASSVPATAAWIPWDDHPRRNFAAVLNGDDQQAAPVAWARLHLPQAGESFHGTDPRAAELVLHIYPRTPASAPAPPASLAVWDRRLGLTLDLPPALADFLTRDLQLDTSDDPLAQVGVSLDTPRSMTELVDPEGIEILPGTSAVPWFMGWALADPDGQPPPALIHRWLTQMCDSTLHLHNYEPALAQLLKNGRRSP